MRQLTEMTKEFEAKCEGMEAWMYSKYPQLQNWGQEDESVVCLGCSKMNNGREYCDRCQSMSELMHRAMDEWDER